MTQIRHPSWRDAHEDSKYPFEDNALLSNSSGDVITNNTFLGASLYPVGAIDRLYLSSVVVTSDRIRFVIGDSSTSSIASGFFTIGNPSSQITLTDSFGRSAGLLITDTIRAAIFQSWSIGRHDFSITETPFVASVCMPMPEIGVKGFLLEDGTVVTGNVWLVGSDGVVVRSTETTIPPNKYGDSSKIVNEVRVDIVGDPLYRRRLCEGTFETPRFLKTLTFRFGDKDHTCGPGDFGDIKILVDGTTNEDTVLRLVTNPKGLTVETVGEKLIRD